MFTRIKHFGLSLLSSGKFPFLITVIAVLLVSGTVPTGFQMDDFTHQYKLEHPEDNNPLTDLFTFVKDPIKVRELLQENIMPWWTNENLRLNFFRPLSAATHWLDHQLWPGNAALMHVHNLIWLALLILCAALIYRQIMTPLWIAGLAVLAFALDDAHGMPAGWIANRNALIAGVFGFLAIYLHIRFRRDQWRAGAVLAPICFLTGLLGAEAAMGAGAYLLSFELILSSGSLRRKAFAILPYVLVGAAWLISYKMMGFGASGSGVYVDPGQAPFTFILTLFKRIPFLLSGQWLLVDPVLYSFWTEPLTYFILAGVYFLLAFIVYILVPVLKHDTLSRFWALGMLLSLLPVSATTPGSRLLTFCGLGGMGLLARLLLFWFEKPVWLPTSKRYLWTGRVVVPILIYFHFIAAPYVLPIESKYMYLLHSESIEKPVVEFSEKFDLKDKRLLILNAPSPLSPASIWQVCELKNLPAPRKIALLSSGLIPQMKVYRADERSLELEPRDGFITSTMEQLFRGPSDPMQVGQIVNMGGIYAEVLTLTEDLRPQRVRFSLPVSLEDPSIIMCQWKNNRYTPFTPPTVGETILVKSDFSDLIRSDYFDFY